MVATCIGGELHEIGIRMVADFFEMEGWDTYYLGANTPADAVVAELSAQARSCWLSRSRWTRTSIRPDSWSSRCGLSPRSTASS